MKFFIRVPIILLLLLLSFTLSNVSAEEVSNDVLKEVLLIQFHSEISSTVKEAYDLSIVQYETPEIISVTKDYLPDSSEELRPGKVYEVTVKINVVNVKTQKKTLFIVLSNNNLNGEFVVTDTWKE